MTWLTPCENRHYSFKVCRILVKFASAVNLSQGVVCVLKGGLHCDFFLNVFTFYEVSRIMGGGGGGRGKGGIWKKKIISLYVAIGHVRFS